MPKPIPATLLATYAKCLEEIRQSYRDGVSLYIPPKTGVDGVNDETTTPADPKLTRGPCFVSGNMFCPWKAARIAADRGDKVPLQPIPEIAEILAYLEELPDPNAPVTSAPFRRLWRALPRCGVASFHTFHEFWIAGFGCFKSWEIPRRRK